MPEKEPELTQQLAASESWGQGGDFVFDPITGTRKPVSIPTAETVASNAENMPIDKAAVGDSETVVPNKTLGTGTSTKKG
jgi:hypothetical protein